MTNKISKELDRTKTAIHNVNYFSQRIELENGFGLIEVLVAALLFSIVSIGLLNFQQSLLQALRNQHEYREIILLNHQYLNLHQANVIESGEGNLLTWPDSWNIRLENESVSSNCSKLTIIAEKLTAQSQPKQISLDRIFCD